MQLAIRNGDVTRDEVLIVKVTLDAKDVRRAHPDTIEAVRAAWNDSQLLPFLDAFRQLITELYGQGAEPTITSPPDDDEVWR